MSLYQLVQGSIDHPRQTLQATAKASSPYSLERSDHIAEAQLVLDWKLDLCWLVFSVYCLEDLHNTGVSLIQL